MKTIGGLARSCAALALTASLGCAGGARSAEQGARDARIAALEQRLEDLERAQGRASVRVEDVEEQVLLLGDRLASQRAAMRRVPVARRPERAPRTAYIPQEGELTREAPRPTRPVQLLPRPSPRTEPAPSAEPAPAPSEGEGEALVIDEKRYRAFVGDAEPRRTRPAARGSGAPSARSRAQAPVTSERLSSGPVPTDLGSGMAAYRAALAAYREGRFEVALAGFKAFLRGGPEPAFLDNAHYWIGESHYGLGAYDRAIASFERVREVAPGGNKVPDAMLKMALAYERLGDGARSRALLDEIQRAHPDSHAAKLSRERIASSAGGS